MKLDLSLLQITRKPFLTVEKIFSPFYGWLEHYLVKHKSISEIKILQGSELSFDELEGIYQFRNEYYAKKLQYLIPSDDESIKRERNLDYKSIHVVAYDHSHEISACLRLGKYPFELSELHPLLKNAADEHTEYLEIGRLVSSNPGSNVGRLLLIQAGIWAIRERKYKGLLAICRDPYLKLFSSFGLVKKFEVRPVIRLNQKYHFIKASFFRITLSTLYLFIFNTPRSWIRNKKEKRYESPKTV